MKSVLHRRGAALAALALPLVACSSSGDARPEPLPLHALVVPIDAPLVGAASEGEHDGERSPLDLALDPAVVTAAATAALAEHGFVVAETLDWATTGAEPPTDAFERRARMVEAARASGADVIVELSLRYDPEIFRRNADTFWLNFPLFLIAGPSNWFIGDQVYLADVELTARIYDRHALEASGASPTDPSSLLLTVNAPFDRATLNFIERAEGVTDYLAGIFVPSGYLSRGSEDVEGEVHASVVAQTTERLVKELLDRREELVGRTRVAPVFVDLEGLEVRRDGDDVVVAGQVVVDAASRAGRLDGVELRSGSARVALAPAAVDDAAALRVYPVDARHPFDPADPRVRVQCAAGTRDRVVRSYTFQVAAPAPR